MEPDELVDPDRPERGLYFDGRVAEDFKLNSGTWVSVGTLRVAGIAALAPLAQDIVVTGHGGDEVRFLVFPNIAACRAHAGLPDSADVKDVIGHDRVRGAIAQGLAKLKAQTRDYTLLDELNTRPRTSYQARVRNTNPDIRS